MWEYLFLQIHDEFLTGRLVESNKLDVKKIFTLLTYALLMPNKLPYENSTRVTDKYKERKIRIWQFATFFSKSLRSRLITTNVIDHYWICVSLKENSKILKSSNETLHYYKKKFYKLIVEAEPNYGSEQYERVLVPTQGKEEEEVTVTVSYYGENLQPALYFGEELQFILSDILYIKLTKPKNIDNRQWTITLELKSERSFKLYFKEEDSANSFLSMVQGYYSLYIQYDKQLNTDIQTTESKLSSEIFSFGPLKNSTAEKYLKEPHAPTDPENKCFLIHESLTDFGHYVLVTAVKNKNDFQDIHFERYELKVDTNQTFTIHRGRQQVLTGQYVRASLSKVYGMQLHPRYYLNVSEIEHVFKSENADIYKENNNQLENLSSGPLVFLPEELDKRRVLIQDKNPLLKKFEVSLKEEKMMLVELQADNGKIAEAFRSGLHDLIKLHKVRPENFLKFYGMVVDKKLSALMEYTQYGDLLTYICQHPQSVPQKVDIMEQIIKILSIMEEEKLFHGNIRLRRFTVFKVDNKVQIKLGYSGIVSYLNTEDKYHKDNNERLPWISPERRKKLSHVTYESECYSVGTTLCEILYRNDQFHTILKLSDPKELWQYLKVQQFLPKPDLNVNEHIYTANHCIKCKETAVLNSIWDLIMKCWTTDPLERPTSFELKKFISDIKSKSKELDEESVTEGLMQVVYDAGFKDEIDDIGEKKISLELKKTELGRGYFGVVWEGRIRSPDRNLKQRKQQHYWKKVAVKRFCKQPGKVKINEKKTLIPVRKLCQRSHFGLFTDTPTHCSSFTFFLFDQKEEAYSNIMLIMEFMNAGNLSKFASNCTTAYSDTLIYQLLQICLDVAEGMVYLSGRDIVHRDLAARNILLAKLDNGQITGKISDFGLARKMEENYRFYRTKSNTIVPFAWMPPECLDRMSDDSRFTTKGDVWSFGTAMWEAFTKGTSPRANMSFVDAKDVEGSLLKAYKENWRLKKENYVPEEIYSVMCQCWQFEPSNRPYFVQLVQTLKGLLLKKTWS
ncbi:hypothetical protein Btru_069519 [Bulinus truncatus]|nr:hypothetical protein Btru_069519 [Bulinus truncatus]